MSAGVRKDILRSTTTHKLGLLRKQKSLLDECCTAITEKVNAVDEPNIALANAKKLQVTAEQLKQLRLIDCARARQAALGALKFLALYSPRCPPLSDVEIWRENLNTELKYLRERTDHAIVFCDVLQEWRDEEVDALEGGDSAYDLVEDSSSSGTSSPIPTSTFIPIEYLRQNGTSEDLTVELGRLAERTRQYGLEVLMPTYSLSADQVEQAMGIIAADARVYSHDVRAQLRELKDQAMVVKELTSAFTSAWHDVANWDFPKYYKNTCLARCELSSSSTSPLPSFCKLLEHSGQHISVRSFQRLGKCMSGLNHSICKDYERVRSAKWKTS